jgi:hypothetical protein
MVRAMVSALRLLMVVAALALGELAAGGVEGRSLTVVPPTPEVTVRNGSPAQLRRLEEALARFHSAGLHLPDLEIEFSDDVTNCRGHYGLFQPGHTPWRVRLCSPLDFVYEHELAHAWERAFLTDEMRHEFMELRSYATWADPAVPWNERGIEGVAIVVQQGLAGLPLPPTLSTEHQSRLAAFALLTGRPAPSLLEWCADQTEPGGTEAICPA